jgi:hypothetical protein
LPGKKKDALEDGLFLDHLARSGQCRANSWSSIVEDGLGLKSCCISCLFALGRVGLKPHFHAPSSSGTSCIMIKHTMIGDWRTPGSKVSKWLLLWLNSGDNVQSRTAVLCSAKGVVEKLRDGSSVKQTWLAGGPKEIFLVFDRLSMKVKTFGTERH